MEIVKGQVIDIFNKKIYKGAIHISNGIIQKIEKVDHEENQFLLPGFVDAHIHIESSMVTPCAFAKTALRHGTVATVSDPHEIANVCGIDGVNYMVEDANKASLKFFFGAPSCVPATHFENAGAKITPKDVEDLLSRDSIWYLSEMMNYPGVLNEDPEIMAKINCAKKYGKPIDGHAPGLRGEAAKKYIDHGISTDHECVSLEEALDKINLGMKILIREGSAAKNYEALRSLIDTHTMYTMLCSDDKHPDDLLKGHINLLVKRALKDGYDLFNVLQVACVNPILHYGLPVGLLRENDPADFIILKDIVEWEVLATYIDGNPVFKDNKVTTPISESTFINNFKALPINENDLKMSSCHSRIPCIKAIDGSLITEKSWYEPVPSTNNIIECDPVNDILKIVVVNRYQHAPPAVGFIKNFGIKNGALASTVAHDSHNIIAVGSSDFYLKQAINAIIAAKGGLSVSNDHNTKILELPIAGLMSDLQVNEVAYLYESLTNDVKNMGCTLKAPFMTLSFMALLVIPKIKISDLGIFDAETFSFYN